jgi:hypothetical protein
LRLQIHSALSSTFRHFKHGPGDVEDACWQLLGELQLLLAAPEDRLFLARLMEPVAEWGPISTPGAPFSKVRKDKSGPMSAVGVVQRTMPCLMHGKSMV